MNDFEIDFQTWENDYYKNKELYSNLIWEKIGQHPLDILFIQLANIYANANQNQRSEIENSFVNQHDKIWKLVIFIRRLGKIIATLRDEKLIKVGVSIGAIINNKYDFRDINISFTLLKYGIDKAGITLSLYEEAGKYSASLQETIEGIQGYSDDDFTYVVKLFGPKEWIEELA
jgi:hypothetical protein